MGMSVGIRVLRGPTPAMNRLADVGRACEAAGIAPPPEVVEAFPEAQHEWHEEVFRDAMTVKFTPRQVPCDHGDVWEIDLSELPLGAKTIQVTYS